MEDELKLSIETRVALIEQKVGFMDEALNRLTDELIPKLTDAVESLSEAVAKWNTTSSIVAKVAGWTVAVLTSIGVAVIGAKLIGMF